MKSNEIVPLHSRELTINYPDGRPLGLGKTLEGIGKDVHTYVPVKPDTSPDSLGGVLQSLVYSYGRGKHENVHPPITVIGKPDTLAHIDAWPELQGHVVSIPISDLIACIDTEKLARTYGFVPGGNQVEASSLLAAHISTQIGDENKKPYQAFISPVEVESHPLLWLGWAKEHSAFRKNKPLAVQIVENTAANEGLLYQSETFVDSYGNTARQARDTLGNHKWLPCSQLLVLEDATDTVPLSTRNDVSQLLRALGTAEVARENGKSLLRVSVLSEMDRNVTFDPKDDQRKRMAIALEILQTQLYMHGFDMHTATPEAIREVNKMLSSEIGAFMLPSVNTLMQGGYLNTKALAQLSRSIHAQRWNGTSLESAPKFKEVSTPKWKPEEFGPLLQANFDYVEKIRKLGQGAMQELRMQVFRVNGQEGRPFYSTLTSEYLPESMRRMFRLGIYNDPPRNLWSDETERRRNEILHFLKTGNVVAVFPFVDEIDAVRRTTSYAVERVGKERVVVGDMCKSEEARQIVSDEGVRIARLDENMSAIDWQKMIRDGVIPPQFLDENGKPIGLKGINMLNIITELGKMEKEGKLDDETWVLMTDGADKNQGEVEDYPPHEWFDAYLYLGKVILDGERKGLGLSSVIGARTGIGRNNYLTHFAFDIMAQSENPEVAKLGLTLATVVWPHAGTRAFPWGVLKELLNINNMQHEQLTDICAAHMDVKSGCRGQAQIFIPVNVADSGRSDSKREWGMMGHLGHDVRFLGENLVKSGVLPMDMTLFDIGVVNKEMGMVSHFQSVTIDEKQAVREPQIATSGVLLPSYDMICGGYLLS